MDNFNLLLNNMYPSWTLYWMTFNLAEFPILEDFILAELSTGWFLTLGNGCLLTYLDYLT